MATKNITVRVPEDVYHHARVRAAQEGRSVSALVADFLRALADADGDFARLEDLQHTVQGRIGQFRARDRLSRDELHDRALR